MPTYEYQCCKCGHRFERFQTITDPPFKKCPRCSGKVERLIGAGGALIFKGSGFYATDYRSDDYKKEAKKEEGKGEKPEAGKEKKPDGEKVKDDDK